MFRTFNMGIGMVAFVPASGLRDLEAHLDALGEPHHRIGAVVEGGGGTIYA